MDETTGSVVLYHESGAAVTLPVSSMTDKEASVKWAKSCYDDVSAMIEAGFKAHAPGLEEGEQKFVVGYIVRREFEDSRDGKITPVVDLYSNVEGQNKFKALKVYLNTDDDIAAFEKASGMNLSSMEPYVGTGDIERGKQRQLEKFVHKAKPFSAVWIRNPKYSEEDAKAAIEKKETYTVPKRKWVRWEGSAAAQAVPGELSDLEREVAWWDNYLKKDPNLDDITDNMKRNLLTKGADIQTAVRDRVFEPWKALTGCWWHPQERRWCPAKDVEPEAEPPIF